MYECMYLLSIDTITDITKVVNSSFKLLSAKMCHKDFEREVLPVTGHEVPQEE